MKVENLVIKTVYLADLQAVESGLKIKNVATLQEKNPYRHPDVLANPKQKLKSLAIQHKVLVSRYSWFKSYSTILGY